MSEVVFFFLLTTIFNYSLYHPFPDCVETSALESSTADAEATLSSWELPTLHSLIPRE